ncbi:MAG: hypothetical protein LBT25_00860 [Candidatus Symbiothrix sp.]|jgi:hypothetical protein|nr:hypothetical protein [Candidatus Symbiothrix sp.]
MHEEIKNYYHSRISQTQKAIMAAKKYIYSLGTIRLLIVICTISMICVFSSQLIVQISAGVIGLSAFLYFLMHYNRQQKKKNYLEISLACDENELKAFDYDFSAFDGAQERIKMAHPFGLDLDIFGDNSLFQAVNRTCTVYGKQVLADWFEKPLQEADEISMRQESIRELREKPEFMHHFRVMGLTHQGGDSILKEIEDFIAHPAYIRSIHSWKYLQWIFPFVSLTVVVLAFTGLISSFVMVICYLILLGISESQAKKINRLQQWIGKKSQVFISYSRLIAAVEQEKVVSPLLCKLQACFTKEKKAASVLIRQLAMLSGELDQRSNLMVHLLFNPLLLWDIRKAIQVEQWKMTYGKSLDNWIKSLGEYDAFCVLGTFAFNHPEYIYPSLNKAYFELEIKGLGHPLIHRDTCVKNDVSIAKQPYFLIITGANMAGKSTYLRTIGVNFVLACIGAPVWADSMRFSPSGLITSLRTSDSLNDHESYFFAELKRLKMIIDKLQAGEKLFIILDEILKGTNSVDKQKGSLALVQQFVRLQSCGIIATHDLHLGSLEKAFPENIRNYRFEADIKENELHFSYQLREGVAQNMNATFLMKKMGITV